MRKWGLVPRFIPMAPELGDQRLRFHFREKNDMPRIAVLLDCGSLHFIFNGAVEL